MFAPIGPSTSLLHIGRVVLPTHLLLRAIHRKPVAPQPSMLRQYVDLRQAQPHRLGPVVASPSRRNDGLPHGGVRRDMGSSPASHRFRLTDSQSDVDRAVRSEPKSQAGTRGYVYTMYCVAERGAQRRYYHTSYQSKQLFYCATTSSVLPASESTCAVQRAPYSRSSGYAVCISREGISRPPSPSSLGMTASSKYWSKPTVSRLSLRAFSAVSGPKERMLVANNKNVERIERVSSKK